MKINKVGQATSSVVRLAQVQSSNRLLGKVSITKSQLRPEIQDRDGAIIKRAETIRSTINRLVYLPEPTSSRTYFDYLLPSDSIFVYFYKNRFVDDIFYALDQAPYFLVNKGLKDVTEYLDRIELTLSTLRQIYDTQTIDSYNVLRVNKAARDTVTATERKTFSVSLSKADAAVISELIKVLFLVYRRIEDTVTITDTKKFTVRQAKADTLTAEERSYKTVAKPRADTFFVSDAKSNQPGKGLFETVSTSNPQPIFSITRLFRDSTEILDLAGIFDGLLYQASAAKADYVAVSDVKTIAANYIRAMANLTVTMSDSRVVSHGFGRLFYEAPTATDANTFSSVKGLSDTQNIDEALTRIFYAYRLYRDDVTVTDSFESAFYASRLEQEALSLSDVFLYILTKRLSFADAFNVDDSRFFDITKSLAESQSIDERAYKLVIKPVTDLSTADSAQTLFIGKQFSDFTTMLDLTGVFDGITYQTGLHRTDSFSQVDIFTRIINAKRVFEDDQPMLDLPSIGPGKFLSDALDELTETLLIVPGKNYRDTQYVGGGTNPRQGDDEHLFYTVTKTIDTRTLNTYNEQYDAILEPVAPLPTGTSFTGSTIFNSSSVTSTVEVAASGDGTGQFGGFVAPAVSYGFGGYLDQEQAGNYVKFNGTGSRWIKTVSLNLSTASTVTFSYIAGNSSNGGDRPESGKNLIFEYSITNGASYVTSALIWSGSTLWGAGTSWATTSITLPTNAKTTNTILRWRQTGAPVADGDHYGLIGFIIGTSNSIKVFNPPFYDDNDAHTTDDIIHAHTGIRSYADTVDLTFPYFITSSLQATYGTEWRTLSTSFTNDSSSKGQVYFVPGTTGTLLTARTATSDTHGYRSTDGGSSWTNVTLATSYSSIGGWTFEANTTGSMVVGLDSMLGNIQYSTDQGASWNFATKGVFTAYTANMKVTNVVYDPVNNIFYAFHNDNYSTGGKTPLTYWVNAVAYSSGTTAQSGTRWSDWGSLRQNTYYQPDVIGSGYIGFTGYSTVWAVCSDGYLFVISSNTVLTSTPLGFAGYVGNTSFNKALASNSALVVIAGSDTMWSNNLSVTGQPGYSYWTSASLASYGSVVGGVYYDPNIQQFVVTAATATSATVLMSANGVNWTPSVSVSGNITTAYLFYDALISQSSTSTLVGLNYTATVSSVTRISRYYDLNGASYLSNPTPHGNTENSALSYNFTKQAKASTTYAVSATTVTASDPDRLFVGSQIAGNRRSGDGLEQIKFDFFPATRVETVAVGKNFDDGTRYNSLSSETLKFTATKRANNEDGTNTHPVVVLDNKAIQQNLRAYRGVSGSTTIKTITGTLTNGSFFNQSSVSIYRGPRSIDDVGAIDEFTRALSINRTTSETTTISDTDKFTIGKTLSSINLTAGIDYDTRIEAPERMNYIVRKALDGAVSDSSLTKSNRIPYSESSNNWLSENGNVNNPVYTVGNQEWIDGEYVTPVYAYHPTSSSYIKISGIFVEANTDYVAVWWSKSANNITTSLTARVTSVSGATSAVGTTYATTSWTSLGWPTDYTRYELPFRIAGSAGFVGCELWFTVYGDNWPNNGSWTNLWFGKFAVTRPENKAYLRTTGTAISGTWPSVVNPVVMQDTDSWFFSLDAKAGLNKTVSGTTVTFKDRDRLFIGQQYTGAYRAGDGLERIYISPTLGKFETVTPGRLIDDGGRMSLYNGTSETLKYTMTMKARADNGNPATHPVTVGLPDVTRVSGSTQENAAFNFSLRAYRGSSGNLILNTIDSTPDKTLEQSSVTIVRPAKWVDEVGILDYFDLFWAVGKTQADLVTVGRLVDTGGRMSLYNGTSETLKFSITKLLRDAVIPDDLFSITDGLTFNDYKLVRDTTTVGLPNTVRVSGSTQENAAFFVSMPAVAGTTYTVSGVTKTARSPGDLVFVGQRYGAGRFSGDPYEKMRMDVRMLAENGMFGSNVSVVVTGSGIDQRQTTTENIKFTITKRAKTDDTYTSTHLVTVGLPFGVRVSGDTQENAAFAFSLKAKQGANVTVSGVTTAAAANFETLFVGQRWGSIRQSQDRQERIIFDVFKSLEAGSNTAVLVTTDRFRTSSNFIRGAAFTQEFPVILGEREGHFSYALTQGVKYEDLTAADSVVVSNLLFRTLTDQSGDLDQFGNINTMVSYGQLRMTDYVDISYLEEDYVGASRSFT